MVRAGNKGDKVSTSSECTCSGLAFVQTLPRVSVEATVFTVQYRCIEISCERSSKPDLCLYSTGCRRLHQVYPGFLCRSIGRYSVALGVWCSLPCFAARAIRCPTVLTSGVLMFPSRVTCRSLLIQWLTPFRVPAPTLISRPS